MSKIYGYCRISKSTQSIERQQRNILTAYPTAIIINEVFTGTKIEGRKELNKLLNKLEKSDTVVFDSVSRMSRDAESGFRLYKELFEKGINLVFLKEGYINTSIYKDQLNSHDNLRVEDQDLNDTIIQGIREYLLRLAGVRPPGDHQGLRRRRRPVLDERNVLLAQSDRGRQRRAAGAQHPRDPRDEPREQGGGHAPRRHRAYGREPRHRQQQF